MEFKNFSGYVVYFSGLVMTHIHLMGGWWGLVTLGNHKI